MVEKTKKVRSWMAQNVISRRKAKGWSQMRLAEEANLGLNTIKAIERDKSGGWPGTKDAIAKALGCTTDELAQWPGGETPKRPRYITDAEIKGAVVDAVKELFPAEFNQATPLNPDLQKIWASWQSAGPVIQSVALYLITKNPEDRAAVHKELRHEVEVLVEHIRVLQSL